MSTQVLEQATQYLSFTLEDETFAIDISKVREVLDFTTVTKVPQTPDFMRGVINLRGGVVPVVDLRLKFGMTETESSVNTCIIIAEVTVEGERAVLGALADSVQEVFDMMPDDVEPAPKIGTQLNTEFLAGMGKKNDDFILLLDIDQVFSAEEIEIVESAGRLASSGDSDQDDGKEG